MNSAGSGPWKRRHRIFGSPQLFWTARREASGRRTFVRLPKRKRDRQESRSNEPGNAHGLREACRAFNPLQRSDSAGLIAPAGSANSDRDVQTSPNRKAPSQRTGHGGNAPCGEAGATGSGRSEDGGIGQGASNPRRKGARVGSSCSQTGSPRKTAEAVKLPPAALSA